MNDTIELLETVKLPPYNQRIDNASEIDCLCREERQSRLAELGNKGLLEKGLVYDPMRGVLGIIQEIKEVVQLHEKLRYFCVVNYGLLTGDRVAVIDVTAEITAGKLIELLQNCHKDSTVRIVTEEGREVALKFVVSRPASEQVLLYTKKPALKDTSYGVIEIDKQEELFAEVTYYDVEGMAF